MNRNSAVLGMWVAMMLISPSLTFGAAQTPPANPSPPATAEPPKADTPLPSQPAGATARTKSRSELEQEFKETLTGCEMVGSFRMVGKGMGRDDKALSPPLEERYVIEEASKVLDDSWMIKARMKFGDVDVSVPVIVRVVWASDTPVIILDQAAIPLVGTYSARVMVYGGFYSGVWTGAGYGGVMSGQIVRRDAAKGDAEKSPDAKPRDEITPAGKPSALPGGPTSQARPSPTSGTGAADSKDPAPKPVPRA